MDGGPWTEVLSSTRTGSERVGLLSLTSLCFSLWSELKVKGSLMFVKKYTNVKLKILIDIRSSFYGRGKE